MKQKDSLLGVVQTLFKWRKPILIITLAAAIGSAVIVLLLPVYYEASTTFYAASPDLAKPEGIFGMTNESMDYYGEDEDIDRMMSIANSSELANFLIDSFNLYEHYGIDPTGSKAGYWVREQLSDLYDITKTKFDALELTIEDRDREQAAAMANAARVKISQIAQNLIKYSQSQVLKTYEVNMFEKQKQLLNLSDTLESIRKEYGVYSTDMQSELLTSLLAKSESRLAGSEARLEAYRNIPRIPRDSINFLQARISATEKEIVNLQAKLDLFNKGLSQVKVLENIHKEASDQLGLDRERYKQILTTYDSDFPAIHLVEAADIPLIKSRPKRTIIVLGATFIAFILSLVGVLLFDGYKDINWRELMDAK
jgi:tyrosine-protein kinase Etk/Wzc